MSFVHIPLEKEQKNGNEKTLPLFPVKRELFVYNNRLKGLVCVFSNIGA